MVVPFHLPRHRIPRSTVTNLVAPVDIVPETLAKIRGVSHALPIHVWTTTPRWLVTL